MIMPLLAFALIHPPLPGGGAEAWLGAVKG